ncbi:MAG: hypothetical protein ACR2FQ_04345 [Pseudonocardiaceae bacterium]
MAPRPGGRWLALAALAVLFTGLVLLSLALVLLRFVPLLLVAAAVVHVVSRRRRRIRRRERTAAPRQPVVERPTVDWPAAKARFARVRQEYAAFECDPLAVLGTPALADVSVPSTARFVDAFAQAQALDTDALPPAEHQECYAAAAAQAERAWVAARDAAERIRLSGIPLAERTTVDRAVALLTLARDSGHPAERAAAYTRARAELAKLERSGTLRLPRAAAAAIARAARGGLTA